MENTNPDLTRTTNPTIKILPSTAAHVPAAEFESVNKIGDAEKNEYQIAKGLLSKTINAIFKIIGRYMPTIKDELLLTSSDEDLIEEGLKPVCEAFITKMKIKAVQFQLILLVLLIFVPRVILILGTKKEDKKTEQPLKVEAKK